MEPPTHISRAEHLKWSGCTHPGKVRPNNEDVFLGIRFDAREIQHLGKTGEAPTRHADYVFAVSDGMGGANAGELASRIAIDKITTLLPRHFRPAAGLESEFADVLGGLFAQVHRALTFVGGSYEECAGMETTLSLCWFTPGRMYFGHIGDSRIYHLPPGANAIQQLSHDDTHVGWLLRQGRISASEARDHPRRHVLQKALGGGNQFVNPQVGAVAYAAGDIFLLCTDGLVEGLQDEQLAGHLRSPQSADAHANPAQRMVADAVDRSGKDNTTALVISVV